MDSLAEYMKRELRGEILKIYYRPTEEVVSSGGGRLTALAAIGRALMYLRERLERGMIEI